MISKDLCVVHLSDLHFSGGMARPVFERLIADIREQIEDGTNVVFVITGDFVSKGEVAENSENVLKFFSGLVDVLAGKINILDVEIVPGNHDGRRAEQGNSYNGNSYLLSLSEYEKLASNIYNEFSRANAKIKPRPICGSTGIDFCGRRIIFTRLDTSSFEMPTRLRQQIEKDLGTEAGDVGIVYKQMTDALKASLERQCKDACQEYQNEVASRGHTFPDLTIIVAHHPISSLNSTGFDDTEDTLFKKGLEFGDVWMSGHTHTAQNYFSSDNSRQRIMLTTGMGWQATPHDLLRYSIYRINLDRNTCQVLNRSSTANDDFKQDVTAGANYEFALYSHLTLPLKLDSVGAAIHANSVKSGHPCGLYADVHVIGAIPKILEAIYEGRAKICIKILQYEAIARNELRKRLSASFFARLSKAYYKQCEITQSEVDSFVSDKGYLSDVINVICLEISEVLRKSCAVDKIVDKDGSRIESHKIDWRVHARYYKGKNRKTIAERSDLYIATRAFNVHGKKSLTKPSNIKWDWLLRAAFESGKGVLINSANPDVNKHPTSWSDFLTVVPLDERLVLNFSNGDRRPLLTFGVSFRVDDSVSMRVATRTLYLLEYLGIEELVRWALAFFMDKYNLKNENVISGLK